MNAEVAGACGYSPDWGAFRVALAFDSFKGSLTARDACAAAASALMEAFGDQVMVSTFPMADGGEGSLDLILDDPRMRRVQLATVDAIGRPIVGSYALSIDGAEAHIETAAACGLPGVSDVPLQPLDASTRGVGTLVVDALRSGARRIVLYLGGSASSDAGAGLLTALGVRFLDHTGEELQPTPAELVHLTTIDLTGLMPEALAADWTVVTDVDAPLTGPQGAARVFAPQKGATADQVEIIERALTKTAEAASSVVGSIVGARAGAGAAGGLAAILAEIVGAEFIPGGAFFAERTGLTEALPSSDLVITGEGRFDEQSLTGKVVGTIANLAGLLPQSPPVVIIAGTIDRHSLASLQRSEIRAAFSLADGPATVDDLRRQASTLLSTRCTDVVALFKA